MEAKGAGGGVMENICNSGVLLSRSSADVVELMSVLSLAGLGDLYSVGEWTSAYRDILVSLHLQVNTKGEKKLQNSYIFIFFHFLVWKIGQDSCDVFSLTSQLN